MNESLNLSTMAIADKVSRYVQARYYSVQLAALQKAVQAIGGAFVQRTGTERLPTEVEEYLALAVVFARDAYLSPQEPLVEHFQTAERLLKDGYAVVLLREILEALDALGVHLQARPEGYDLEALDAERLAWRTGAMYPSPILETPPAGSLVSEDAVDAVVTGFFEVLPEGETRA